MDALQDGCKTGFCYKIGWVQDSSDVGLDKCRKGWMKGRMDAGQEYVGQDKQGQEYAGEKDEGQEDTAGQNGAGGQKDQ